MRPGIFRPHLIFPTQDMKATAHYYETVLEFQTIDNSSARNPHIRLMRDAAEIILIQSKESEIVPIRERHGYGYDAFFMSDSPELLEQSIRNNGGKIVEPFSLTDYLYYGFVVEDIDRRWLGFGMKGFL